MTKIYIIKNALFFFGYLIYMISEKFMMMLTMMVTMVMNEDPARPICHHPSLLPSFVILIRANHPLFSLHSVLNFSHPRTRQAVCLIHKGERRIEIWSVRRIVKNMLE